MNTGYLIYQAERTRSAAEPIAPGQQPARAWRRIAGSC